MEGLPVQVNHGPGEVDHLTLAFRHTVAHEKLIAVSAEWGRWDQSATTCIWNQAVVRSGAQSVAIWGLSGAVSVLFMAEYPRLSQI